MTKQPNSQDSTAPGQVRPSRHSACAAWVRDRELARLRRMSVEERIVTALTLRRRFAWLRPHGPIA